MSKNYELLQQVEKEKEKERELFGNQSAAESKAPSPSLTTPAQAATTSPRAAAAGHRLKMEAKMREESARLVQQVFLNPKEEPPKAVIFVAVESGDGCTSVCGRAGDALASQAEGNICLVDANFRSPALHQLFGLENRHGLTDAIAQAGPIRSFAIQVAGSNLWVLPAGTTSENKERLLNSEGMRTRLAELVKEFDYVLLDSPALAAYSDALTLGALVEGAILVLQSDSTRRQAARSAKEVMEGAGVRLLGAVLNKRTYPIPQALYERL